MSIIKARMMTGQKAPSKLIQEFFRPIDGASLIVFRVFFGGILLWDVWRYWSKGWIAKNYISNAFQFKYYGFEWVQPWAGDWMYWHFAILGILASMIILGLCYRLAAILFTIGFSYIFLIDQANYLNHFYMVILLSTIMIFVPANRSFSLDALIWPKLRSKAIPQWSVWLLRLEMEIILILAGLVKINPDWLQLQPLEMWLAKRADYPVMGYLFTQEWSVAVAAYGAIALHVLGAPLLLYRKTRLIVFLLYCCFHLINSWVFSIGIFPWMAIAGTLIFFDYNWPRQVARNSFNNFKTLINFLPGITTTPSPKATDYTPTNYNLISSLSFSQIGIIVFFVGWGIFQICMPLRHVLYPGNVSWTEEGHLFAWQMKLRDKKGRVVFKVEDPKTGQAWTVDNAQFLNHKQVRKMTNRPEMILQFAHHLERHWQQEYGVQDPVITVDSMISLNGRPHARMIDQSRDLTNIERSLMPADWILPLTIPLQD